MRLRVLTEELDDRMDFAGAGRVREEAMDETEPERFRTREGAKIRSLTCPSTGEWESAEDFDVLGRIPMIPDQNDV